MDLKPGAQVAVGASASSQFAGRHALTVRITGVDRRTSVSGWAWIEGYVLDGNGDATGKRRLFVHLAGLHPTGRPAGSTVDRVRP